MDKRYYLSENMTLYVHDDRDLKYIKQKQRTIRENEQVHRNQLDYIDKN